MGKLICPLTSVVSDSLRSFSISLSSVCLYCKIDLFRELDEYQKLSLRPALYGDDGRSNYLALDLQFLRRILLALLYAGKHSTTRSRIRISCEGPNPPRDLTYAVHP